MRRGKVSALTDCCETSKDVIVRGTTPYEQGQLRPYEMAGLKVGGAGDGVQQIIERRF
jgi:hypothetical protein